MNVFISYSHIDNEFALKLSSVLEADGYDVFIDNKIPIGNNIYKDIGKGIPVSYNYYSSLGQIYTKCSLDGPDTICKKMW